MESNDYWSIGGFYGLRVRAALRTLQFFFAVVVAALYGVDLHHDTLTQSPAHSSWVYAEVVAALSILTCATHCLVTVTRVAWCTWDLVLFVLWVSLFGDFASTFLSSSNTTGPAATQSVSRMKAAVWVDLVSVFLWAAMGLHGIFWCCASRRVSRRVAETAAGNEDEEAAPARQEKFETGGLASSSLSVGSIDSFHKDVELGKN